jgi:hypothetical protein
VDSVLHERHAGRAPGNAPERNRIGSLGVAARSATSVGFQCCRPDAAAPGAWSAGRSVVASGAEGSAIETSTNRHLDGCCRQRSTLGGAVGWYGAGPGDAAGPAESDGVRCGTTATSAASTSTTASAGQGRHGGWPGVSTASLGTKSRSWCRVRGSTLGTAQKPSPTADARITYDARESAPFRPSHDSFLSS